MTLLTTDLFRRNVIGLLVTTATLAGLYLTQYREDWSLYRSSIVPEHVADAGGTVDVGGLTWSVGSVRYYDDLPGYGFSDKLPEGTGAVVVTVDRKGGGPDETCDGVITDGSRRWQAEGMGGQTARLAPGVTDNCAKPGPVQFTFVLPRDVRPTAVDLVDYRGQIMVRLGL